MKYFPRRVEYVQSLSQKVKALRVAADGGDVLALSQVRSTQLAVKSFSNKNKNPKDYSFTLISNLVTIFVAYYLVLTPSSCGNPTKFRIKTQSDYIDFKNYLTGRLK